ncbi:MAG: non-canonical purine NTP pyrophosphatase [Actinocatenispora sp.]
MTAPAATQLLLASRNDKKLVELRRILAGTPAGARVRLVGLSDVPEYEEVPESGLTFAENALIKAREGAARTGLPTVADDSGLTVTALGGMPGVFSARWSGRHGDDEANLRLLLGQIGDVPDAYRAGAFLCAAALVWPDGREQVVEGTMPGRIIREPRGAGGFGYDPIFVPDGFDVTTAELDPAEKDSISHRGQAFRALADLIAADLAS